MTYRENAMATVDPPRGWVDLVWRWLQQRRQDREAKALAAPRPSKFRATYMVRLDSCYAWEAKTLSANACPGAAIAKAPDPNSASTTLYFLCTAGHCCCEVTE